MQLRVAWLLADVIGDLRPRSLCKTPAPLPSGPVQGNGEPPFLLLLKTAVRFCPSLPTTADRALLPLYSGVPVFGFTSVGLIGSLEFVCCVTVLETPSVLSDSELR
jgi:hypothetical protein